MPQHAYRNKTTGEVITSDKVLSPQSLRLMSERRRAEALERNAVVARETEKSVRGAIGAAPSEYDVGPVYMPSMEAIGEEAKGVGRGLMGVAKSLPAILAGPPGMAYMAGEQALKAYRRRGQPPVEAAREAGEEIPFAGPLIRALTTPGITGPEALGQVGETGGQVVGAGILGHYGGRVIGGVRPGEPPTRALARRPQPAPPPDVEVRPRGPVVTPPPDVEVQPIPKLLTSGESTPFVPPRSVPSPQDIALKAAVRQRTKGPSVPLPSAAEMLGPAYETRPERLTRLKAERASKPPVSPLELPAEAPQMPQVAPQALLPKVAPPAELEAPTKAPTSIYYEHPKDLPGPSEMDVRTALAQFKAELESPIAAKAPTALSFLSDKDVRDLVDIGDTAAIEESQVRGLAAPKTPTLGVPSPNLQPALDRIKGLKPLTPQIRDAIRMAKKEGATPEQVKAAGAHDLDIQEVYPELRSKERTSAELKSRVAGKEAEKGLPWGKRLQKRVQEEEGGFVDISALADWIRKSATGKDPTTDTLLPAEEIPLRTFMRDYLTTSIKTSLRKVGAPDIEQMLRKARVFEYRIAGHAVEVFQGALAGFSKAEIANLALAIEGRAKFVSPKVATAAETVKSINRVIGNAMESAGVTLKASSGEAIPFKMRDPTGAYWHHEYTKEFWSKLGVEGPTREAVIRSLMREKGVSRGEAEDLLKMARRFGEKRVSAQYAREWDFPGYRLDADVMVRYYGEAAERIARAKVLGPKDIADPSSPIGQALSALEAKGGDVSTAYKYLARVLGRDAPPEAYKYKVASTVANVMTVLYLQMFPISNLVQIPMSAIHAPLRSCVKGIFGAALDYKGASKRALQSGATLEAHKVVRDIAGEYVNKLYLMTKSEIFNRTISDNIGRYAAQAWFDGLKRNPNNKLLRRKLTDITMGDVNEMLRRGSLNARELDYAGYNMATLTNGTVHVEDMPYAWSNSPLVKLYWIFKRYAFSTGANIWRSIKTDPLRAITKLAFFQLLAGEVIGDLKKFITEGMEGVERRGEWTGIEDRRTARLFDDALQGWALGIPGDIAASLWVRGELNKSAPFDLIDDIGQAVRDLVRAKPRPVVRKILQRAPVPFGITKRIQKEYLPEERERGKPPEPPKPPRP